MSHFKCILQNDDNLCNEKSKCNIEDARSNIAWGYFKIGQSISSLSIVQFSPIFKLIIVTWISSQNLMKIEPDWSLSVKIKSSIITDFDRHSFIYLWEKLFTTFLKLSIVNLLQLWLKNIIDFPNILKIEHLMIYLLCLLCMRRNLFAIEN